MEADFADPSAPERVFDEVEGCLGGITALVMCRESVDSGLLDTTLESFDRHFAVNARASWLLIREYTCRFHGTPGTGRLIVDRRGTRSGSPSPARIDMTSPGSRHCWMRSRRSGACGDGPRRKPRRLYADRAYDFDTSAVHGFHLLDDPAAAVELGLGELADLEAASSLRYQLTVKRSSMSASVISVR